MKNKIGLGLFAIAFVLLSDIAIDSLSNNQTDTRQKAGLNLIKCTAAKYLLNDVDTTRQISPSFNNLGNLHFQIST